MVLLRQNNGENEWHSFVRVERLSRDADLGNTDYVKRLLSLVVAVKNLRYANLRKTLMSYRGPDWNELTRILKARSMAKQAAKIINRDTKSATSIKKEIGVISNITKSCSYSASYHCNNNSSRSLYYVKQHAIFFHLLNVPIAIFDAILTGKMLEKNYQV